MIQEFEEVVFTEDLPQYHLEAGDVGTVVMIHDQGAGYAVEAFFTIGDTYAVVTVDVSQVRPVSDRDLQHARQLPKDPA